MIKELILTTMFSFAPLINGVSPSKAGVFFSSSDSETIEEIVTLDDGKKYHKVYDAATNDVTSNDDLIVGNAYKLNLYDYTNLVQLHTFFDNLSLTLNWLPYDYVVGSASINNGNQYYENTSRAKPLNFYSDGVHECYYWEIPTFNTSNGFTFIKGYMVNFSFVETEGNLYTYVILNSDNFYLTDVQLSTLLSTNNLWYFFSSAGDNIPYHYEEIGRPTTLFDIINDWYLSLFSNETLDNYKFTLFGKEVSMTQYLCNVATIITLVSLVIAVVSITIFIFKLSAGLFKW